MGLPMEKRFFCLMVLLVATLISIGGGGGIMPPVVSSSVSSERLELIPSNFLTFSFYLLVVRKI